MSPLVNPNGLVAGAIVHVDLDHAVRIFAFDEPRGPPSRSPFVRGLRRAIQGNFRLELKAEIVHRRKWRRRTCNGRACASQSRSSSPAQSASCGAASSFLLGTRPSAVLKASVLCRLAISAAADHLSDNSRLLRRPDRTIWRKSPVNLQQNSRPAKAGLHDRPPLYGYST